VLGAELTGIVCLALQSCNDVGRPDLRVVTIIDNVPIKIIDAQRQRGSLLKERSVPLLIWGTETVLLSRSAETLPTSRRAAKLASLLERLQHFA
jgi:hypothetical protein